MEIIQLLISVIGIITGLGVLLLAWRIRNSIGKELTVLETKSRQLDDLIDHADQMIVELNKLSDYIVTKVEDANRDLLVTLNKTENTIQLSKTLEKDMEEKIAMIQSAMDDSKRIAENFQQEVAAKLKACRADEENKDVKPVVSFANPVHAEAVRLAQSGMDARDIARKLNIGQGEVTLLLGTKGSTR